MERHFLDSTGLSHFWQRIREHFAPIDHEHTTDDITDIARVAVSNSFNDLDDKPEIPSEAILYSGLGQNTDGAMTQKASTDVFNSKMPLVASPTAGKIVTANGDGSVGCSTIAVSDVTSKMNLMQSPTVGRITVAVSDGGVECSNISVADVVKNDGGSYGVSITGNAASASTINTSSAIGGAEHPVYVDSTGHVVACDFTLRTVTVMPSNPEPGCWYFIVE